MAAAPVAQAPAPASAPEPQAPAVPEPPVAPEPEPEPDPAPEPPVAPEAGSEPEPELADSATAGWPPVDSGDDDAFSMDTGPADETSVWGGGEGAAGSDVLEQAEPVWGATEAEPDDGAVVDDTLGFDAPDAGGDDLPPSMQDPGNWVIEVEEEVDPNSIEVERVGTVEETVRDAAQDVEGTHEPEAPADDFGSWGAEPPVAEAPAGTPPSADPWGDGGGAGSAAPPAQPTPTPAPAPETTDDVAAEPADVIASEAEPAPTAPPEPTPAPEAAPEPAAAETPAPAAAPVGFQFGKRDPHEKAKRLARVLVSDMITYNPERHRKALENGTLVADFEEEIAKSWKEYVEQVGADMAESNGYWRAALNEILAKGDDVF